MELALPEHEVRDGSRYLVVDTNGTPLPSTAAPSVPPTSLPSANPRHIPVWRRVLTRQSAHSWKRWSCGHYYWRMFAAISHQESTHDILKCTHALMIRPLQQNFHIYSVITGLHIKRMVELIAKLSFVLSFASSSSATTENCTS
jgi:hypothetical protein